MEAEPTEQPSDRAAATAELDRRAQSRRQAEGAALRRRVRLSERSTPAKALDVVSGFAHPELAGVELHASRLDAADGAELLGLARRRRGDDPEAAPLTDDEERRYETLIGKAVGDETLFARKRSEQAEREKVEALQRAAARHPQAESLIAAVFAEPDLFDGLHYRFRPDATVLDELGREERGVSAVRILELDNISALFVVVAAIAANGGHGVVVTEHGAIGDGLPRLPHGALAQLRRNHWIETAQVGSGTRVGLGPRSREIAAKWSIELPAVDGDG